MSSSKIVYCTPTADELQPNYKVKCKQINCNSVFTNMGNFEMHMERHHKMPLLREKASEDQRYFYCPALQCIYHVEQANGRHFKNMKYLRQHYQKVHLVKVNECKGCGKKFATAGQLNSHEKKLCGRKFICDVCNWNYESMEALLTHARRKGHILKVPKAQSKQLDVAKPSLKRAAATKCIQSQQTQTEIKRFCITSVQTDKLFLSSTPLTPTFTKDLHDLSSAIPRDNETQTEYPLHVSPTNNSNSGFLDQMLAQSTHTQTCDDLLTELGFTDIQTQTNWSTSSLALPHDKHQYTSTATSTGFAHDELLVSTETQTSFTQCLLDSCSNNAGDLYITQHTQTCDTLLDGLFGAQESDLISGFQSTYTQT